MSGLVFGPPSAAGIGEPALNAEVRRRSLEKFNEDCTEANRFKNNGIIAEPEKAAEYKQAWREAVDKAQARHAARLDYFEHEYLGRPRTLKAPPRPVAVPQFYAADHEQHLAQAQKAQAEAEAKKDRDSADLVRSARLWWERHAASIMEAAARPKPKLVNRFDWFGPEGLQQRYLDKLAKAAAEADGYIFTEDF